ncbi:DUF1634 domain-containing protein [Chitinophaga sp. sic0106]|uniref:DUF1634 domain-containing protein n=1 Tax=Chitinophaga sp. sic0106 TaxID=2854785 RepID=UPI001C47A3E1|nr:DUF1634 domain-containing protein [Chitinophaga sp. sic0106]MBV7532525.1 DUF1634 domain-containing protein [Chitinophaga sp. sic0106]
MSFIKKLVDRDVEVLVGKMLRYGVFTASGIVLAGGIFYLIQMGSALVPNYQHFHSEGKEFTTFSGILKGAATFSSTEVIQLGVMVLLATPILRIVMSLGAFALEKDKLYVGITALVLAVILFSMFGGLKV